MGVITFRYQCSLGLKSMVQESQACVEPGPAVNLCVTLGELLNLSKQGIFKMGVKESFSEEMMYKQRLGAEE